MESVARVLDTVGTGLHVMLDERADYEVDIAYYYGADDAW